MSLKKLVLCCVLLLVQTCGSWGAERDEEEVTSLVPHGVAQPLIAGAAVCPRASDEESYPIIISHMFKMLYEDLIDLLSRRNREMAQQIELLENAQHVSPVKAFASLFLSSLIIYAIYTDNNLLSCIFPCVIVCWNLWKQWKAPQTT